MEPYTKLQSQTIEITSHIEETSIYEDMVVSDLLIFKENLAESIMPFPISQLFISRQYFFY